MTRSIAIILVSMIAAVSFAQSKNDTINPDKFNQKLMEKTIFNKVNQYRKQKGVAALNYNTIIYKVADDHTQYLSDKATITHSQTTPGKETVNDRFKYYVKVENYSVGENIARTFVLTRTNNFLSNGKSEKSIAYTYEQAAEYMFNAWKQSDFHNTNMLSNKFQLGAISVYLNKETKEMTAVQVFAKIN